MSRKYLVGGTVVTGKVKRIENAALVLEGGKISSIFSAKEVQFSKKDEIFDLAGKIITPVLIDAHVHIGVHPEGFPHDLTDTNEIVDPLTPHLRVIDAIYPDDTAFQNALTGGVTCVQVLPGSANVIGGQGAIIKTKPDIVERMVVDAPSAMKAALGENPIRIYTALKKSPNTRMAVAAMMREALVKAQNYKVKKGETKQRKAGRADKNVFECDIEMESLLPVLDRKLAFCVF